MDHSQTVDDMIFLCRAAINGVSPDKTYAEQIDRDKVIAVSSRHMISAIVSVSLESAGLGNEKTSAAIMSSVRKNTIFDAALSELKTKLEENNIRFMPLKGAVLKHLYPKYGMREFADYDVLIDPSRADDVKTIMESLGFETKSFGVSNQDVYYRRPLLNFEIHTALFGSEHDEAFREYYSSVFDRLVGDGCEKRFTPEDFYVYFIAHEYKHFSNAGTGIRSLLDTYVLLRNACLDRDYVVAETEKLGIGEFEEKNRSLALHLFGDGKITENDREMLDYIVSSGTYGTVDNRVRNTLKKKNQTKFGYMISRFSVPFSKKNGRYVAFAASYPFFYKNKILLPVLPFYRVLLSMKKGVFKAEADAIRKAKR
ncbi:MAG: nucleotidyltransferase family protein [Clostridia bacterium]|nr:nucleotidyltransferase family protein [Clostridia bacterium]MBR7032570.1 nucleotidyltransferase family protein [Clostridia bacterium]